MSFLKSSHPEVIYQPAACRRTPDRGRRSGSDQRRADEFAGKRRGGCSARRYSAGVHVRGGSKLTIEVHDSGPGLSAQARSSLFEPTISFKKGGMGLGLSIARRSALLCGGDIETLDGELGGAAFRVVPLGSQQNGV